MSDTPLLARLGFSCSQQWIDEQVHDVELLNSDTRSAIRVTIPNHDGVELLEHDPNDEIPVDKAAEWLSRHLNAGRIPPDTVAIEVDDTGALLSCRSDPNDDVTYITSYPPLTAYQLPVAATANPLLRSELVEHARFYGPVDLVAYSEQGATEGERDNRYVFKWACGSVVGMWHEVQFLSRLPPHPNMALLDRLVVDEVTGSQLVGFTTRYVASLDLGSSRPLLKLKWLRELMQAVDDLNLKHGVVHQDIASRNLLVDPDTDSLVLIDFGVASRVGKARQVPSCDFEGEIKERDDGKSTWSAPPRLSYKWGRDC